MVNMICFELNLKKLVPSPRCRNLWEGLLKSVPITAELELEGHGSEASLKISETITVTPSFGKTMDWKLIAGRDFTDK